MQYKYIFSPEDACPAIKNAKSTCTSGDGYIDLGAVYHISGVSGRGGMSNKVAIEHSVDGVNYNEFIINYDKMVGATSFNFINTYALCYLEPIVQRKGFQTMISFNIKSFKKKGNCYDECSSLP